MMPTMMFTMMSTMMFTTMFTSKFTRIRIVWAKEIVDNLRDRKTLVGALFYPLLGPLLMAFLFTIMGQNIAAKSEQALPLPVVGAENAPALVQFFTAAGAEVRPGPADPEAEVRAGNLDAVIVVPSGFGQAFAEGRPATIRLIADASRQSAQPTITRVRDLLEAYQDQVGSLRLLARGVDPGLISPLAVENVDVSTPQSQAALFLNILPYFIIFSVFAGGMYLAIDTIAGERERGSLEPLLTNPVARWELLLGKLGATLVFTVVAVAETLMAFYAMLRLLPTEKFGVQVSLSLNAVGVIFLITVPIMLLASALQMILSTYSRSFKEAQTYLGYLPLIPALPGMVLGFITFKTEPWMSLIPTFAQQLLINQVMRGEALNMTFVAVSAVVTVIAGVILTWTAVKLYGREQVLFGR